MAKHTARSILTFLLGLSCGIFVFLGGKLLAEQQPEALAPAAADDAIAIVNGQPLPQALLDLRLEQWLTDWGHDARGNDEDSITVRQRIIDDLVLMELLVQQAQLEGLDKRPEIMAGAELAHKTFLAQRFVELLAEQAVVRDDEVRARYQQLPEEPAYKISHILVEDQLTALEIIAALERGASFKQLADQHSLDQNAGAGGSLGWQPSNQLMYPIADAAASMQPGESSQKPVETAMGWHILQLEEKGSMPAMSFEEAKVWLRDDILNEKVRQQFEELRKKAHIELRTS